MTGRLTVADLPDGVRERLTGGLGSAVLAERSCPGGFSPGVASVLELADGRTVFVKSVGTARHPDSPGIHRREIAVLRKLPGRVPAARLLWSDDDDGDWVTMVLTAVDGRHPAVPWRRTEVDTVLTAMAGLAAALTPDPVGAQAIAALLGDEFDHWQRSGNTPFAELESHWRAATAGNTLLHMDLRADNLLLTEHGVAGVGGVPTPHGVTFVDWPHVARGAPWVDLVLMLPSMITEGVTDPDRLLAGYPPARDVPPEDIDALLAALAGFLWHHGLRPVHENLPRLRDFQAAQARATLDWLTRRRPGILSGYGGPEIS